ncbi:hypothetical protein ACTXT7_016792, partial [Hymenolepis weldensis]
ESGRGHQAFVGADNIRGVPPPVFDSTDYSSVAWLSTCSDKIKDEDLWRYTLNALFLTYCLHLGGYPMMWFDEFDEANESLFFSTPSASNRPIRIPASWLAACLLFHIQSNDVNNFEFGEMSPLNPVILKANRIKQPSQNSEVRELGWISCVVDVHRGEKRGWRKEWIVGYDELVDTSRVLARQ